MLPHHLQNVPSRYAVHLIIVCWVVRVEVGVLRQRLCVPFSDGLNLMTLFSIV